MVLVVMRMGAVIPPLPSFASQIIRSRLGKQRTQGCPAMSKSMLARQIRIRPTCTVPRAKGCQTPSSLGLISLRLRRSSNCADSNMSLKRIVRQALGEIPATKTGDLSQILPCDSFARYTGARMLPSFANKVR